ncbi:hypothetical protein PhCBS80983_g05757 [Powellomyces hirtus]|uniref:Isochorismatase-like domain-containing protein n=1 Tax=Powellomyces hirtus TaxID=109895 RepID=A0A507DSQ2_9FUNG|nr:hypothetical protein PhCBS80983_g05757 [Powellomyces hirtus]
MSSTKLPQTAALILIDIQEGFCHPTHWGTARNNPLAESHCAALLAAWRKTGRPVFHVQHTSTSASSPLRPGQPGCDFKKEVTPRDGEPVVTKTVNSAFIGTDLDAMLKKARVERLVIAGLTTDHCVSTTTRMAGNMGYKTILVQDACATFGKVGPSGKEHSAAEIHEIHITSLNQEFATVLATEVVLAMV